MSLLKRIDHVTICTTRIRQLAYVFIRLLGGTLVTRVDDTNPGEPSSMMLWCIEFTDYVERCECCGHPQKPKKFGVALVQGIDRREKSQVTVFVERHGEGMVQHLAFDVGSLDQFLARLAQHGIRLRGETLVRDDGFGLVKQVFGKGFGEQDDPAQVCFPEFLERPKASGGELFSSEAGKKLYQQMEEARNIADHETLFDFSKIPEDWDPGSPDKISP